MKTLSGETLSRIADCLQKVNSGASDTAQCAREIGAILSAGPALIEIAPAAKATAEALDPARLRSFDADALARINALLPWTSFSALGGERALGSAWQAGKRDKPQPIPDPGVAKLHKLIDLAGKTVLEAGCYEGHHTISLAQLGAAVCAFDGRIENVIKTLVRVWAFGLERSALVDLIDIERDSVREQLSRLGRKLGFDVIHHRGVLYHLSRPVEHLIDMASLCEKHLYLHTQVATPEQANTQYKTPLGDLRAFAFGEPGTRSAAPFAGLTPQALWLTTPDLCEVLRRLGFAQVQVLGEVAERNGLRLEVLATRVAKI